jgi:hypothetical protein
VVVDGERVAWIKHGQRIDVPVTPGQHTVFLQISRGRSPQLKVDLARGQTVSLECAPTDVPPFGPGADAYVDLRRAD